MSKGGCGFFFFSFFLGKQMAVLKDHSWWDSGDI